MLSEESRPPYVRPMLTKLPLAHYRVENTLSRPAEWYRSENIDRSCENLPRRYRHGSHQL